MVRKQAYRACGPERQSTLPMSLCSRYLGCSPENQKIYSRDGRLIYHRCLDCGIIWRDESSFDLELPYNEQYFNSKNYAINRDHKIEKSGWLLEIAGSYGSKINSVLEIGCSLGNTLEAASRMGLDHLGIDVSSFAVGFCKKNGLNASTETLEELLQQGRSFELIFMQHVLEHFKDPFYVLEQCNQLLPVGGLVMILIPNSNYSRAKRQRERHRFYKIKGVGVEHYAYFNYNNLSRVLESCGFKTIQTNYPLLVKEHDSFSFMFNRLARRLISIINLDQELVMVAQKAEIPVLK